MLLMFQVATRMTSPLAALQGCFDILGVGTDCLHGDLQLFGADAELLRPIADLVIFVDIDAGAVLSTGLGLVVLSECPYTF